MSDLDAFKKIQDIYLNPDDKSLLKDSSLSHGHHSIILIKQNYSIRITLLHLKNLP